MTGYLLDTNIVSELRKRDRANPGVTAWIAANQDADMWLSVLTVGEIRRGIELLARRDPASADILSEWLEQTLTEFADRILDIDIAVAQRWAQLNVLDPIPVIDGLLAATADTHHLTLVTRNTADVATTGVATVNPFTEP